MVKRVTVLARHAPARRQRGAAFIVLVLMIIFAATALVLSTGGIQNEKVIVLKKTTDALTTARSALIAYAVSVLDSGRPGDQPCPATDYTTGLAVASCNTATSRQGYLPWSTLGLPQLFDGTGAPLLYAVSNGFKDSPRAGTLNSDTAGEFFVNGENAISVVFAPGASIGSQNRTGTFNVTNFLELRNADGDNIFETASESDTFNDRLVWITPAAFFPAIELRAINVAKERLLDYFSFTGRYPLSNRYLNDYACWTYGGRLPYPTAGNPCLPAGPGSTAGQWTMTWPSWFFANYWDYVIHYAVAEKCTAGTGCSGSGNYLTVDGTDGIRVLLIRQGIPNNQTRPCTSVSQCLDDAENSDSDRNYITPSISSNDKLTVISP